MLEGLPSSHKTPGASPSSKTEGVELDLNRKSHIQGGGKPLQVDWALRLPATWGLGVFQFERVSMQPPTDEETEAHEN